MFACCASLTNDMTEAEHSQQTGQVDSAEHNHIYRITIIEPTIISTA